MKTSIHYHEDNYLSLSIPSTFSIKCASPNFLAKKARSLFHISIKSDYSNEAFESLLKSMQFGLATNNTIDSTVVFHGNIKFPFDGYAIIGNHRHKSTNQVDHFYDFLGKSPSGKNVNIAFMGDGLYEESEDMWCKILSTISFK